MAKMFVAIKNFLFKGPVGPGAEAKTDVIIKLSHDLVLYYKKILRFSSRALHEPLVHIMKKVFFS